MTSSLNSPGFTDGLPTALCLLSSTVLIPASLVGRAMKERHRAHWRPVKACRRWASGQCCGLALQGRHALFLVAPPVGLRPGTLPSGPHSGLILDESQGGALTRQRCPRTSRDSRRVVIFRVRRPPFRPPLEPHSKNCLARALVCGGDVHRGIG